MKIFKLILSCWCLLYGTISFAQVNLVTNSELEMHSCGENNNTCPHFDDCLDAWTITHGTPNYVSSRCPNDPSQQIHHVQLVCQETKSEGIMTTVDLQPGLHKLFVRAVVTNVPSNLDVNLRVSLDRDLVSTLDNNACQQAVPTTSNTQLIYNQALNEDGEWHWVIIDVDIDDTNSSLNQLMLTGLSVGDGQTVFSIDCIYLYRMCNDAIIFHSDVDDPLIIEDGTYVSCSFIRSDSNDGASVGVPADAAVELVAKDYVLLLPNFHAQHTLCARTTKVPGGFDESFRPPCLGCAENSNRPPRGSSRTNYSAETRDSIRINKNENSIAIYPNPANSQVSIDLPEGEWEISIYNLLGVNVYQQSAKQSISLATSDWPRGLYLVEITNRNTRKKINTNLLIQ